MKLHKIELFNFRQFKGKQCIEFSGNDRENVTVVYGENGRGKTGVFRALMFCLYGERSLSQDELSGNDKKEGLGLINEIALKENKGDRVESKVIIDFSHKQRGFIITRKICGMMKSDGKIIQDKFDMVELQETDDKGNTHPVEKDRDIVDTKIQDILNERLRDYFLFDGERIERLTRNKLERRNEVRKGIRALLDLDAMELAIKGLDKLISKNEKDIKNKSTGELQIVSTRIDNLSTKIENLEEEQEFADQELRRLEHRIREISDQVKENEQTAELERRRQEFIENKRDKQVEQDQLKKEMAFLLNRSGQLVAYELIEQLHEELELHRNKGQLPPPIRKEFVEKLLSDEQCICGTSLSQEHQNERRNLLEFLKNHYTPGLNKESLDLLFLLNRVSGAHEGLSGEFNRLLIANKKIKEEVTELENKIGLLDEKLGKGGTSIDDLIDERVRLLNEAKTLENDISLRTLTISNSIDEREEFRKDAKVLGKKQEHVQNLIERCDLAKETWEELRTIYNRFAGEVKQRLSEKSTENFSLLADEETLKDIKKISIDNNYMLDVLNWSGQRRLGEISAGQRQIVSLSFIMALIQVAGDLEVPLFMDTPFGRLSGVHRDHLLDTIPKMASQWILLVTDTEFTGVEADALKQTDAWKKVYELIKEEEGVTRIVSREANQFIPKRKSIF